MSNHRIILEDSYPDREKMKEALEKRGIVVLSLGQAVDVYAKKCALDAKTKDDELDRLGGNITK